MAATLTDTAGAKEPEVSIIIPCFNRVDRTQECWRALPASLPADTAVEIIFIDNASTDETGAFLRELEAAGAARVIRNAENAGYARANNQGAHAARGRHLILLNNDTVPLKGWLEPLLPLLDDEKTGITGSKLVYPDGRVQHAGVILRRAGADGAGLLCEHIHRLSHHEAPWVNVQREFQCVTAACMGIRRELYLRLGGFDEAYVNGHEDMDLCFRVREAGLRVIYCPRSMVVHYESSSQGRHVAHDRNTALFLSRWSDRLRLDVDEAYAMAQRPDVDHLKAELQALRESLAKMENHRTLLDEKSTAQYKGLRGHVARWLGVDKNQRLLARDLKAARSALVHLRRVTEGLMMYLDARDMHEGGDHGMKSPTERDAGS